jgi:hypothetical protein
MHQRWNDPWATTAQTGHSSATGCNGSIDVAQLCDRGLYVLQGINAAVLCTVGRARVVFLSSKAHGLLSIYRCRSEGGVWRPHRNSRGGRSRTCAGTADRRRFRRCAYARRSAAAGSRACHREDRDGQQKQRNASRGSPPGLSGVSEQPMESGVKRAPSPPPPLPQRGRG